MTATETTKHGRSRLVLLLVGLAVLVAGAVAIAASSSGGGSSYSGSMSSSNHATPMTAKPAATTPSTVSLAANATIGQKVLVDSNGMTLYLFVPDGTGTQSTVPAQFKPNWPPVTATGSPTVGSGLDATKVGVQTQSDGTRQVTYNGHLLYTFIMDKNPGDVNGQGQGPNNWFVLDSSGNAIKSAAASA